MKHLFLFIIQCLFLSIINIQSQSLLDELNNEKTENPDTLFAEATFKTIRIINGQSVETAGKNGINLIIAHRFGNLNSGIHQFYGIDQSTIRLGLEYGLTNKLDIGFGRSREQELADGYFKARLFRQSTGAFVFPFSVTLYSSMAATIAKWTDPDLDYSFIDRFRFVNELIIARKFTDKLSAQIVPGFVHRNLTKTKKDKNLIPYIGAGGRFKISKTISLSTEYYWVYPGLTSAIIYNPLSFGIDFETGGHVFQIHLSNSRGMYESIMIPENTNSWTDGDIGLGFNIVRNFSF